LSSLAARRAGNRPNLGSMGGSTPAMGGMSGRRGPPGGLSLSDMKGATKDEGNKFTDYSKIMYVLFFKRDMAGSDIIGIHQDR
jgi:mitogen-activated protein kinase kinase